MVYTFMLIWNLSLVVVYDIYRIEIGKRFSFFITYFLLVIVAGLSFRVGIDAMRYAVEYKEYPTLFELRSFDFGSANDDPLWVCIGAFFRTFFDNFIILHTFHALFVNFIIFILFWKYAKTPFICILLYFLSFYIFFNFETLRESMAVAIYLLSFDFLIKKKWLQYFLICLISFFMHSSAIFTFIIPFLLYFLRKNSLVPWLILVIFVILIGRNINTLVVEILPQLALNERILYKAGVYFGRDSIGISTGVLLKNVVFPLTILILEIKVFKEQSNLTVFAKLFLLIGFLSLIIPVFDRLLNYIIVLYVIYVANVINLSIQNVGERSVQALTVLFFILFFAIGPLSWFYTIDDRIGERNYNRYYPYSGYPFNSEFYTREKFYNSGS